jgi:hypothetical protein
MSAAARCARPRAVRPSCGLSWLRARKRRPVWQAYRLHLVIGPRRQAGDFVARVQLATTDPQFPQEAVVVVGLAQSGPAVNPVEVVVPTIARGEKGKELRRMQVFNRGGPIRLLGVYTGNPGLRAEIVPKSPGHFYEVILRYAGGWKPGPVSSTIRVRTDDREFPVLTAPFRGSVQ